MIALALVLMMFTVCAVFLILFLGWVGTEHVQAKKYREVMANGTTNKVTHVPGTAWRVSFKSGGKIMSLDIVAPTEAEAILKFVKQSGVDYSKIVSSAPL